ncbi:MAG TPA: acyl-ACP thioesterase domain-containing protein, partial [Candidatus Limnocylindrales bacterium]|nr:acyl-ACP thioesterase domain-containing protein [Candidatus Limnocylindrales bacterium]
SPDPVTSAPVRPGGAAGDGSRFAHDASYRVRFDEAGPDGRLRTSGFMRYAQDLAWLHSTALGFGREWYAERGLTWLVRAAALTIHARVPMGSTIAARTEVVGMRRVFARRRGTFHLPDGTLAAAVDTDWVLIDARGALTRIPAVFGEMFGAADRGGAVGRVPLRATPDRAPQVDIAVRRHELDPLGHVNNAVYLDWLEEVLLAGSDGDGGGATAAIAAVPRIYRLEFVQAAAPGTRIRGASWREDERWSIRLTDAPTGADLFRATVAANADETGPVSE